MKYIVTGAEGFLGSAITQRLDGEVIATDRHTLDVTNPAEVDALFAEHGRDAIVIHAAAIISIANKVPTKVERVNVGGALNIQAAARKYGVRRLVHISSVHAIEEQPDNQTITEVDYFSPSTVDGGYAKTKALATQRAVECRDMGLDVFIVHPSGTIGPGDKGSTGQAIREFINGDMPFISPGGYDFVDVRDVADGVVAASHRESNQNNILSGAYHTTQEIFETIGELFPEYRRDLPVAPEWLLKAIAGGAELYSAIRKVPPTLTRYSIYTLHSNGNFSHAKATSKLGFNPRPLEDTVRDTVEWLRSEALIS